MRWWTILSMAMLIGLGAVSNASATDQPANTCKPGTTDDRLLPVPADLVARAKEVFQLPMPDNLVRKTTVFRCLDGKTLLCTTGANLSCGKANLDRVLPGAAGWCHDHAEADTIPAVVTGHATIYRWRCSHGTPMVMGIIEPVDARGFLARNWKPAAP